MTPQQEIERKILRCPVVNTDPHLVRSYEPLGWYVTAFEEGAHAAGFYVDGPTRNTQDKAITAWNAAWSKRK